MSKIALERNKVGRLGIIVILAFGSCLFALFSLRIGRYHLSLGEILVGLIGAIRGEEMDQVLFNILFNIRLPRIILALVAGGGLAVAGTAFQALFSNPLATPDTLGVASGASFGAVLGLLLNRNLITVQLFALFFGFVSIGIVFLIAAFTKNRSQVILILGGMVVSALFQACISLVKLTADPQDQLPAITFWLMGGLSGIHFRNLPYCIPFILTGTLGIFLLRWRLNAISLQEDVAQTLGLNVKLLQILIVLFSTMITASVVSCCGQIGWVGLLIPHIARMLMGSDNRYVVPCSISLGALFFVLIDTVARSAFPAEVPISILTAVIGAPFFIFLLQKTGGVNTCS